MTLFGGSFLKWSCHIINNGHNNYHHHYIFHKLLSSSMEEVLEFLFAKSTVSSVCSCACMFENGKEGEDWFGGRDALQAGSPGNI